MTSKEWLGEFWVELRKGMATPHNYAPRPFTVCLWVLLGFGAVLYGSLNPIANISNAIHQIHDSFEHRAAQ